MITCFYQKIINVWAQSRKEKNLLLCVSYNYPFLTQVEEKVDHRVDAAVPGW